MRRADRPQLTPSETMELFEAVLANAAALALEARVLLDNGYIARAYGLAHLSHEETAKCFGLLNIRLVQGMTPDAETWDAFWNKWRSHKVQLALAGDIIRQWSGQQQVPFITSGELPDDLEDRVRALHAGIESVLPQHSGLTQLREDSFYVDRRDGHMVRPKDVIREEMASGMVGAAEVNVRFLRSIVDIGVEQLIEVAKHPAMRHIEAAWGRVAKTGSAGSDSP